LARFLSENPLLDPGTRDESQVFLWNANVPVSPPYGYQPTSGDELPIANCRFVGAFIRQSTIDNRQSKIDNDPLS
jgi:hypothetical protein